MDEALLAFVWGHYQAGWSKSDMSAALAGISFYSRLAGGYDPTKLFILSKALHGWARLRPVPVDSRRPIDRQLLGDLLSILPGVAETGFKATLLSLAFSCAFFGAFRVGELVAAGKRSLDTGLRFADVLFCDEAVLCRLPRSKTDQTGQGRWVTLGAQGGVETYPVQLAAVYARLRPMESDLWLLHADGSPLTQFQFGAVLKQCLRKLGLPCEKYGAHSFCIGAATCAAASGLPAAAIQELSCWKSKAFKSYVRPDRV